jgi:hypothetical protein
MHSSIVVTKHVVLDQGAIVAQERDEGADAMND